MTSRTFEGKHTTRFIIELKGGDGKWIRSMFLKAHYPTRDEAQAATAKGDPKITYRVRMK